MDKDQAYGVLLQRVKEHALLASCGSVLGWDERTYMPRKGSAHRAEQMALLARMSHEMLTAPRIGELLAEVADHPQVKLKDSHHAANVREIRRVYDRAVKLPKELVEEIARVTTRAQQIWQEARQAGDFAAFRSSLETIVALKREEAQAIGYKESPYDALLDEYEPGATTAEITKVFAELREDLVPLIGAIAASGKTPRRDILEREYPVDRQELLGREAAAGIGFDFQAGRLDVTTHPFCSGMGPGDVRITTRYNPRHFNEALFGILHESGHAIYEQGLDPEQFGTPVGSACSLGIHESQSRMWENQVGRSRAFWEHFFPKARLAFPEPLADVALDDWYFAINDVQPSFIRVEADEATYNMHIILRFELEQALVKGDLAPADVPGAWSDKFQKFFKLTPPNDRQGCLQDIHWSMGGIGYFPTYTLGNLYGAQFMEQARQDLGNLDADFKVGEFGRLKTWLNDKVHRPGQRWRAGELCQRVTGRPLSHKPLMNYLRGKYAPLYGI
ncbi:peptidase M32 [Planctomycetaceae bacterium SCGC AG-212-F19]|nr:peptidase M32 [Planctomycetaceae bacterium SCGC AG-212-F19]